jgi:ribosome biogenesis GTPase
MSNENVLTGYVTSVHKTGFDVNVGGVGHFCIINNSYIGEEKPIVNDTVFLTKSEDRLIITNLAKRRNAISRYDACKEREQGLAANIDLACIVTSANLEFSPNRIRRFLTLLGGQDIKALIVLSKKDLAKNINGYIKRLTTEFPDVNYLAVNSLQLTDVIKIFDFLPQSGTALLMGSSGVGKSTIINTLTNSTIKTREVSDKRFANRGKHTTSARTVYTLPDGRRLIDIPGVRIVGVQKSTADASEVFAQIVELSARCKYTNCQHKTEDGCAVLDAVNSGRLTHEALERYQEIAEDRQRKTFRHSKK